MSTTPQPPPTQQNASTTEPVQGCPLKPQTPCDVDKLSIEVIGGKVGDDAAVVTRKLETTKRRRHERVRDVKSWELRRLLRTYDLIIDIIADPDNPHAPSTPASISGSAQFHGRSCSTQLHALLVLVPLGLAPELAGKSELIQHKPGSSRVTMPKAKVYALQSFIDRNTSHTADSPFDTATDLFAIIRALWDSNKDKAVELQAHSCGLRAREDRKAANQTLIALTRIHRRSKWSIGIKIPPLGSFKAERVTRIGRDGVPNITTTREASGGMGYYKSTDVREQDGVGLLANEKHTRQVQQGSSVTGTSSARVVEDGSVTSTYRNISDNPGDSVELVVQDGALVTNRRIQDRLARAHGFEIVITHNATEVPALDAIKRVKEQIQKITKALTDIDAMFKKVPQVGWKFGFQVSVFTGTIVMEWWPEYTDKVLASGRYHPVENRLQGKIVMEIINLEMSVSFGVDAQALDSGLVLKATGTITLKASIDAELSLTLFKPKQIIGIESTAAAKLSVVGYINLLGKTLADAVLSAETGLELKTKLHIDWSKREFDLKGELKSKDIEVKGYISVPWWFDKKIDPAIKVMKGVSLYKFN